MVALVLFFKWTSILFSIVAVPIYIPTNSVGEVSLFSSPSTEFVICRFFWRILLFIRFFDDGQSDQCDKIPHCSFDLQFCNNLWCWASPHMAHLSDWGTIYLERVWRKRTLLHCWWECKLVQPLWRTVWRLLKKLKSELPYDIVIPLLGIGLEENHNL